jgi:hypothetical protein
MAPAAEQQTLGGFLQRFLQGQFQRTDSMRLVLGIHMIKLQCFYARIVSTYHTTSPTLFFKALRDPPPSLFTAYSHAILTAVTQVVTNRRCAARYRSGNVGVRHSLRSQGFNFIA